ncbi:MAG: hypothetical protein K6D90_10680 [Lachnospiraceae bacterium]|nr:hypothetical protein [Lachnospiraceae bacterium]
MLKKRLLTRLTRLGLAMYVMTWCMSFTVCAAEDPIADLSVAGTAELLVEAENAEVPDYEDPAQEGAEVPEDLLVEEPAQEEPVEEEPTQEEAVQEDPAQEDSEAEAEELLAGDEGETGENMNGNNTQSDPVNPDNDISNITVEWVALNKTELTIKNPGTYELELIGFSGEENQTLHSNISAFIGSSENCSGTEYEGAAVTVAGDKIRLTISTMPSVAEVFYLKAEYQKDDFDRLSSVCTVTCDPYCYEVDSLLINGESDATVKTQPGVNQTLTVTVGDPDGALLNPDNIHWGLTERGAEPNFFNLSQELHGVSISGDKDTGHLVIGDVNSTTCVDVVALYFNDDPNDDFNSTASVYAKQALDVLVLEAHIPEQALKIDIYKTQNTLPFVIRNTGTEPLEYNIRKVFIEDHDNSTAPSIPKCVGVTVAEDGKTLNFNVSKSWIGSDTAVKALLKQKCKASVWFEVEIEGTVFYLKSEEVSFSCTGSLPTAKTVKPVGTLNFDSYKAGTEGFNVTFTGAKAGSIFPASAQLPQGLTVNTTEGTVNSTDALPATGKGNIKLAVSIDDPALNLPENYSVNVSVPYVIKNGAPVVTPRESAIQINPTLPLDDSRWVDFDIKGTTEDTDIAYIVTDSKNVAFNETTSPLNVSIDYCPGDTYGWACINATDEWKPGEKYKVLLFANNTETGRTGASKTITVSIPSQQNLDPEKCSLTVKGKGALDASVPGSEIAITLTGKNFNVRDKCPVWKTVLENGTDITDLLYYSYDEEIGVLYVNESGPFALLKAGYAQMKATTTVSFEFNNVTVAASYTGKIAQSTVSPKLGVTAVTINPVYNNRTIFIPVTNLESRIYDYNVEIVGPDAKTTAPFTGFFNHTVVEDHDVIEVTPVMSGLENVYGKSCTVKITPVVPESNVTLKAKTVNAKIKVLDITKSKNAASVSAKVKGSIDPVRDDSAAKATLTVKNVFEPENVYVGFTCENITTKVKNQVKVVTGQFKFEGDGWDILVRRQDGFNLTAGTYQANMILYLENPENEFVPIPFSFTFKVTRGKTDAKIGVAGKLINRVYDRTVTMNVTSTAGVNTVSRVELAGTAYDDVYVLEKVSDGVYRLRFAPGYVEMKNKKPITKAVTKTVPVNVYFAGSDVADKINVKIVTDP